MRLLTTDFVCTLDLPSEPVPVRADSHLIRQVINNLIENAIKYSSDEPKVDVKVAQVGDEAITSGTSASAYRQPNTKASSIASVAPAT